MDFTTYRREKYDAFMGLAPKHLPHWEHWSNPDAETWITGIDAYAHPKKCRERLLEMYPRLDLPVPKDDAPITRPTGDDTCHGTVRWGTGQTGTFIHGEQIFKTAEDVFNFSPLEHADMTDWGFVVEHSDFTSVESIEKHYEQAFPKPWGEPEPFSTRGVGFYNTTFMWPMLTFGWELFLECCLDERFERVMDEFAEINRRVFSVFAKLPVKFVTCHDDIVTTRGPVCSPEWMHKYVFPRYEEYWGMLKAAGKRVIFMADGCMDQYADDVFACGASGIISEPYTDYKTIAKNHKDCFLAGEGDNRILKRNNPDEISDMVDRMVETSKLTGGYVMCIGNHIPWDIPGEAIKLYLDLAEERAVRT
ncbi:MAG TPA: uroporphyrinogen decarboxylase family protein [Oscillospiraceae bacterium]|nr:uroporphyrinogen decarboxylase family protein [Oscillospiraceae bacterium]HPF55143.1 uroporphyrinogen decarboxylase family protein [Clostridiales bacterium]HPK34472.1 uroporphyrinogen decarboxylase family protein [Oscillospiraceae bacterium]HPR76298.1 uroporphyrinogen decarboxylase family protein [Oscillospiraceae bacterium]